MKTSRKPSLLPSKESPARLILMVGLVSIFLYLIVPSPSFSSRIGGVTGELKPTELAPAKTDLPEKRARVRLLLNASRRTVSEEDGITYTAADCSLEGLDNLIVRGDSLLLGERVAPSSVDPFAYRVVGVYTSPEQTADKSQERKSFDAIALGWDAVLPPESVIQIEFRTRSVAHSAWSPWLVVEPPDMNRQIPVDQMADAWQYRVTLWARDPAGVELRSVTISTHNNPLFGYSRP